MPEELDEVAVVAPPAPVEEALVLVVALPPPLVELVLVVVPLLLVVVDAPPVLVVEPLLVVAPVVAEVCVDVDVVLAPVPFEELPQAPMLATIPKPPRTPAISHELFILKHPPIFGRGNIGDLVLLVAKICDMDTRAHPHLKNECHIGAGWRGGAIRRTSHRWNVSIIGKLFAPDIEENETSTHRVLGARFEWRRRGVWDTTRPVSQRSPLRAPNARALISRSAARGANEASAVTRA